MLVLESPEVMGNAPVTTPAEQSAGISVKQVAAGGDRSCAVLNNGRVRCWGENRWAKLGYPAETYNKISMNKSPAELGDIVLSEPVVALAMAVNHTCSLSATGTIYCWGLGETGQLGNPEVRSTEMPGSMPPRAVPILRAGETAQVKALALGAHHSCALLSTGTMRCWGQGFDGQLGTGTGKIFGKVGCRNAAATCLGDESEELPPPDVLW